MHSLICPHRVSYVQCRDCNCNAICIHGYIRDMCEVCVYSELCAHIRKNSSRRRSSMGIGSMSYMGRQEISISRSTTLELRSLEN